MKEKKIDEIQDRRNRRARIKRRRRIILFSIIIIIASFFFIFKTDIFHISIIEVNGNKQLEKNDIIKAANIKKGENIILVDKKQIESNIKELGYIKEVNIETKLPKYVTIDIVERQEKLQIKIKNKYQILDREGFVLKNSKNKIDNLLCINNSNMKEIKLGRNAFNNIKFEGLDSFILELDNIDLLNSITEINILEGEKVDLIMNENLLVEFGELEDINYKVKLLNQILIDVEEKGIICKKIVMDKGEYPIIITDDNSDG